MTVYLSSNEGAKQHPDIVRPTKTFLSLLVPCHPITVELECARGVAPFMRHSVYGSVGKTGEVSWMITRNKVVFLLSFLKSGNSQDVFAKKMFGRIVTPLRYSWKSIWDKSKPSIVLLCTDRVDVSTLQQTEDEKKKP